MAEPERRVWARNVRYEFMEWKLFWEGQLNRSDLEAAFDISTPQASVDLKNYRGLAEGNVEYDSTAKSFVPGAAIRPRFLVPSADRLLLQLRALMSGALPRTSCGSRPCRRSTWRRTSRGTWIRSASG